MTDQERALGALDATDTWHPNPVAAAGTRVGELCAEAGVEGLDALWARSVEDPRWFWQTVVQRLGIEFSTPYREVFDDAAGPMWTRWFVEGRLNVASSCVDRHAAERPDDIAVVWEGEDGAVRRWTWSELRAEVDGLAHLLTARGIGLGDAVGIFMPMLPETVAAVLAVAKVGATFLPIFSGYAADAIATRLEDARTVAVIVADGFLRRGKVVDMLAAAEQAVARVPTVQTVVVVPRLGRDVGPHVAWPGPGPRFDAIQVDSEHPLLIAYTSGTTGRPKGSVHVHGGFLVKVAQEVAFQFDVRAGRDVLFWFTDIGWIMGPWEIVGTLANGATLALYEGAPDHPDVGRLWRFVADHGVTVLGISPTLIRSLMPHGDEPVAAADLSALRVLGSTGEPWNDEPWRWYARVVGGGRCPVINISGGTEIGACLLSPHPVQPISPRSLGGPCLGMAVDVFDDEGRPVREAVGELVCTKPWPGMTRGLYGDPERFLDLYWSRYPGVWWHGDFASVDPGGQWYLHGRSDDTIKVAGKRLGPAEVESLLVSHPAVVEAAAIGMHDDVKGETLGVYVVLADGELPSESLGGELAGVVADGLGKSFRPSAVWAVAGLPKTRNAKVARRVIRNVAVGDVADVAALEDPAVISLLEQANRIW